MSEDEPISRAASSFTYNNESRPHMSSLPKLSNNSRHALPTHSGPLPLGKLALNGSKAWSLQPLTPRPPQQKPRRRASLLMEGEDGYTKGGASQEADNSGDLTTRTSSPALLARNLGSSSHPQAPSHLNPANGPSAPSSRPLIVSEELGARPSGDEWTAAKERARAEAARRRATLGGQSFNPLKREISKQDREKVIATLARSYLKNWLRSHGALVRPPKMHDNVRRVISAWFDLVDADGGGSLDSSELLTALKAAGIPCDDRTILEMIKLMDLNSDGEISWTEFENFMSNEFASGKTLLSGEYVLPSGTSLPFGAMITKMKRNRMIEDIMEGGERRQKWIGLLSNAKAMQEELNLFANIEASQDEEHRKSEKEGRALNALAEMCEREQNAAAAAVANAKRDLAANRMEAAEAAAVIEAAENRAEAARTEAEAARRAAFESAEERRAQREARGVLRQASLRLQEASRAQGPAPPPLGSAFRKALRRMGSSELAAAEAETALKSSAGAVPEPTPPQPQTQAQPASSMPLGPNSIGRTTHAAPNSTCSTTPAAPLSNPSVGSSTAATNTSSGGGSSSSSMHSGDNNSDSVGDDSKKEGAQPPLPPAGQVEEGDAEGGSALLGTVGVDEADVPSMLAPASMAVGKLSVVMEADKEGKGNSPSESPLAGHSPPASHDASRQSSLGHKSKEFKPAKSPVEQGGLGPERLNTAARAARRESAQAAQSAAPTPAGGKSRHRHSHPPKNHNPTTLTQHLHTTTTPPYDAPSQPPLPPPSPRHSALSRSHLEPQQQARPRDLTPQPPLSERSSPSRPGDVLVAAARAAAGGDVWSVPNSPSALELASAKKGPPFASPLATARSLPGPAPPPLTHLNNPPPTGRAPFARSITAGLGSPSTASLAAAASAALAAEITQAGLHLNASSGASPGLRISDSSIPLEQSSVSGNQPLVPHQRMWKSQGGNKEQPEQKLSHLGSRGSSNGCPHALPQLTQSPSVSPRPHRGSLSPLQSSFRPAAVLRPAPARTPSRSLAASLYDPKPPPHQPN